MPEDLFLIQGSMWSKIIKPGYFTKQIELICKKETLLIQNIMIFLKERRETSLLPEFKVNVLDLSLDFGEFILSDKKETVER